ncbi:1-acyl-sn-glycerol-3-phosphate acyltransferase [Nocardioides luteus]|uniref:1-acyl-sn-glycerol-3-phosphate acyltransferase n=1 Tax=Nocardioides luteus TaxID=1844 RepID=A0ABQ5ST69_9ACTN|nr:lysophospholipid acyltransferase family protein [Nocardioides luteus]MDR7309749.1 1-acyl-sn-glycerol-3-phosphate acyltransferase [Nocardioides luteus]GGR61626.1 1-acyl-sn-glycerol-3-phosphate acyltransferase [Nocardioides luteus]GLJ67342.1 1-acyl-sn-glycerol-3-phosphate acyltransferase [Nocardioides luteus]
MGKYRKFQEGRLGWAWVVAVGIVKPVLLATTKHQWEGGEKIPESGGAVIALNHVSEIDPFTAAHIVWDYGRRPSYLAKAGLFKGALGKFLRAAGQIPVDRKAGAAAFDEAVKAVNEGSLVVVYVEGSITKDPTGWPMRGKSGAARIALATGAPVYPVGQWGAQELLPAYSLKPNLVGRKMIQMKIGDPVDLKDLEVQDHSVAVVNEATDRIMKAIVGLVADIREEEPPSELFDPKKAGINETGDPKKSKKDSN